MARKLLLREVKWSAQGHTSHLPSATLISLNCRAWAVNLNSVLWNTMKSLKKEACLIPFSLAEKLPPTVAWDHDELRESFYASGIPKELAVILLNLLTFWT